MKQRPRNGGFLQQIKLIRAPFPREGRAGDGSAAIWGTTIALLAVNRSAIFDPTQKFQFILVVQIQKRVAIFI